MVNDSNDEKTIAVSVEKFAFWQAQMAHAVEDLQRADMDSGSQERAHEEMKSILEEHHEDTGEPDDNVDTMLDLPGPEAPNIQGFGGILVIMTLRAIADNYESAYNADVEPIVEDVIERSDRQAHPEAAEELTRSLLGLSEDDSE